MDTPSGVAGAPSAAPPRHPRVALLAVVVVPVALATLSYALFLLSDRFGGVGPLDRAAFGWTIPIPLWVAAPVIGGFAWACLTRPEASLIATITGVLVGGIVAGSLVAFGIDYGTLLSFVGAASGAGDGELGKALLSAALWAVVGAGAACAGAWPRLR